MATIQIKNVPEGVHKEMRRRAERAGKSLQSYLLDRLIEQAEQMPLDEWLDGVGMRRGSKLSSEEIVRLIHEAREERDARWS